MKKKKEKEQMKMKKMIALLMSLTLCAASLAACGGATEAATAATEEAPAEAATADAPAEEVAEASAGVIEINFPCIWVGEDSKAPVFAKMVESFNAEYDGKYHVNIEENTDYDAYNDAIRTQIATGAAPDIFTCKTRADVEYYSSSGKCMDLTSFLDGDIADHFVSGATDAGKIDGINYAMPYEMAYIPVMYNQRLLDAAGAKVPTSFDELWETCEALKASGVTPMCQMTANNAWTTMLWYSYALAACGGKDVFDKGYDDPAYAQAAELVKKMYDYTSSDAIGADASVVNGHFFTEDTAIYTNGTWILGRINSDEANEGLYDNLAVGAGLSDGGKNGNAFVSYCQAYLMCGAQEDPAKEEGIKAFLSWITEPESVLELANSSGSLFSVSIDETQLTGDVAAKCVALCKNADFIVGSFESQVSTPVANAFPPALESFLLGDINAQEFAEQLAAADE